MIEIAERREQPYVEDFARSESKLPAGGVKAIAELRRAAMQRFDELGFPSRRDENWLLTNLDPITKIAYERPSAEVGADLSPEDLHRIGLIDLSPTRIVFLNGRHAPRLSSTASLPSGSWIASLAEALNDMPDLVEAALGRHADFQRHPFTALNTALWNDGAFIHIGRGTTLEEPIHLVFISTNAGEPTVTYPRVLITAESNAGASIVESYLGRGNETYFTNAVTEIIAGENAVVGHYKLIRESAKAFHIGTTQVHQARDSNVTTTSLSLGGLRVRNDLNLILDGEGAECSLSGLYIVGGRQHIDNHTSIEHAKPHCTSRELYKGVLDGRSRAVFNGKITVRPDAQKTDAQQANRNLLLSSDSLVSTKPDLEIFANDVKCRHGATIGQIDEDALFYARSRGIDREDAERMLIYAFASEMIDPIDIPPLRDSLAELLLSRLGSGG